MLRGNEFEGALMPVVGVSCVFYLRITINSRLRWVSGVHMTYQSIGLYKNETLSSVLSSENLPQLLPNRMQWEWLLLYRCT